MNRLRVTVAAAIATMLAAYALDPVFDDGRWIWVAFGAVAVVFAVAAAVRMAGAPRALSSLFAVAGLAGYINAVFAHETAIFGILPGRDARHQLHVLVRHGLDDISHLQAPVPAHRGLMLLTVAGIGLVAVLVDFIANVARRPALAGLPMLALFAVSAATVPDGVGVVPFLLAGAGYLMLLLADSHERVARWGRPLGAGRHDEDDGPLVRPERPDTAPLTQVGRRVGAAALGVAIVLPALVPGLHSGLFGTSGGTGHSLGSQGGSTVTTYNPITRIKRQLVAQEKRPLLTYSSDVGDTSYFRMTALDDFNGVAWSQTNLTAPSSHNVNDGIPTAPGLNNPIDAVTVTTQVRATDGLEVPWLPVPYPATKVSVDGDWRYDDNSRAIFSTEETTRSRGWTATSQQLLPTLKQLRQSRVPSEPGAAIRKDLQVAGASIPDGFVEEARRVTADSDTTYDKALALQSYFRDNFRYSTTVTDDGSGTAAISAFLNDRVGYCVQFASTMALMARVLGIPARVAIGFTRGTPNATGDYVITTHDAHAWPELYFDGVGWLPFEPTPRDGRTTPPPYPTTSDTTVGPGPSTSSPTPSAAPSAGPGSTATPGVALPGEQRAGGTGVGQSSGHRALGTVLVLVLVLLALAPATGRWLTRRRRWANAQTPAARAHAAWRELTDDVSDLAIPWVRDDSPRRSATRLAATAGLAGPPLADLRRLASAEELARYAPGSAVDGGSRAEWFDDLPGTQRRVRRALAARASWWRRVRAIVVPRSTVRATTSFVANRIADALDAVDALLSRVRTLLTPRRLRRSSS